MEKLKERHRESDEKRHKEHKHKKHKHKEQKHKKDKHRDREDRDVSNPLSSLLKEMTPDSSSSEPLKAKMAGSSWPGEQQHREDTSCAPVRVAHVPNASYVPPQHAVSHESRKTPDIDQSPGDEHPHQEPSQDNEEESDDELGDLPVPVFAE